MIASEVLEAKFQQHLNAATKESLSLLLTCAIQKQCGKDVKELSENKIYAPEYFFFVWPLCIAFLPLLL